MSTTTKHHIPPWAKDESCLHNRDNLTPEQVGRGYRLVVDNDNTEQPHERWLVDQWVEAIPTEGTFKDYPSPTYRVPITIPWPPPPSEGSKTDEGVGELLCRMRAMGWMVAVHNDYRQNDKLHTFWLFTRGETCVKGEGEDDYTALMWAIGRAQTLEDHAIAHHEASKENPKPSPQVGMGVGLPQDASIPTPETRVTGPGFYPTWLGATQPASDQDWKSRAEFAEAQLALLKEEHERDKAMAAVCMDLHEALGVQWGEDPYFRIRELTQSPWISTATRMPTREDGDRSGYIFRMGKTNPYLAFWNSPPTDDLWMPIPPIPTAAAQKEDKPWTLPSPPEEKNEITIRIPLKTQAIRFTFDE